MSDTAEQSGERSAEQGEELPAERGEELPAEQDRDLSAEQRAERRWAARRAAERVLWRPCFDSTVGERLALLTDAAPQVYDLDQRVDMYGDRIVETVEERVAALLGKEAAAFFPSGTMAQQVALRCWAGRTGNATVAMHPLSHPEVHERHAFSTVSGLRIVHPTGEPRLPSADEIRDLEEPFGALLIELPLRDAGFVLPSWDELVAVTDAARERDAVVHVDGARLWECAPHFGRPLDEIADVADSVYVSFYKSLAGLGGAALAGPKTLVDEAKAWRHRYGGQVLQQFPTALSALIGLEKELLRLPEYVAHARVVAAALREGFAEAGVPWVRVHPEEPHTHQFQVWLPYEADALTDAGTRQAEDTKTSLFPQVWSRGGPGLAFTEVTVAAPGLEWTAEDVRSAVADFVARLPRSTA
ncbi:threonine aldolase [Streptomyces montanus]|uniref:Threonine aldolase n=1 Tax=Streptomyces montanus TaxID=2580423 RepID=A0A5R9FD86_9ACTN|nr:beta-eliminating lyase-related protein [Streptomyces montanus]TLS39618.1 threonine aldolase [Streptomyces montanus]